MDAEEHYITRHHPVPDRLRSRSAKRRYAVAAILAAVLCAYGIKTLNFVGRVIQVRYAVRYVHSAASSSLQRVWLSQSGVLDQRNYWPKDTSPSLPQHDSQTDGRGLLVRDSFETEKVDISGVCESLHQQHFTYNLQPLLTDMFARRPWETHLFCVLFLPFILRDSALLFSFLHANQDHCKAVIGNIFNILIVCSSPSGLLHPLGSSLNLKMLRGFQACL